jgi:signal transduction protein with GAF and PtsI domain
MAVRDQLKKHRINFDDFWRWAEKSSKGSHRRLFDSYNKALEDAELAEDTYVVWVRRHWNSADLEAGQARWEQKQKRLQDRAMVRLERIFNAYKKAIAGKTR